MPYKKIYLQAKIGSYPSSSSPFCLVLPCVVVFVTALRVFGCPSCLLALRCIWMPLLPTRLALPLVAQHWPCRIKKSTSKPKLVRIRPPARLFSWCSLVWSFLLRLFVRLGAHLANLPCIAFGCPSCRVALPCPWSPNLGQAVLKYLTRNQNWFLSVIQLVFLPSAPLCGRFRYDSSCVSLLLFVCLGAHLANWPCIVFGCSSCQLAFPSPCYSCVSLRLFVRLGTHVANSPCIAFGRPCCELALRCVRVPNLGEAVLKNLPPRQNWFLSVLRLVFFPNAPLCGRFRYGSSCVSLQLIVRFVTVVRAFRYTSSFVWDPILPTGLALRLGAPLSNSSCL
jgi:hypothetical protein